MAIKNISGIETEKIDVNGSGDTWNLLKNAKIVSVDYGFNGAPGANNNTFNIDGSINAAYGIVGQGGRMTVNVGGTGSIDAQIGIYMVGTERLDVDVDGQIYGMQYGIQTISNRTTVDVGRNGSVGGTIGIYSTGTTSFSADIDGEVNGLQYGVISAAADAKLSVGGDGSIVGGQYGVYFVGPSGGTVVNHGSIEAAGGYGVFLAQPGGEVRNSGDIGALIGVVGVGDGGLIVNQDGGMIIGTNQGILASTSAGHNFKIVNHGTVISSDVGYAIVGGDGNEKVVNDGLLNGAIVLGGGDDVLDGLGGSVKGDILGGLGDDTLITDKTSHKLVENGGEGTDTVKSSANYTLSAEVEKLFLIGNGDVDGTGNAIGNILRGNSGDNKLKGLGGADVFRFSTGGGDDTVLDLATGVDDINLSDWDAISNFTKLLNHAQNDGNGNVVIEAGGDSLKIANMLKGDLDMNDFIF